VPIDHLDHLVLTVRDIDATCEFYRRALGLEVVIFGVGRVALRFGAQKINLHRAGKELDPKAARPTPGSGDLCLLTGEPLEAWQRRLEGAGVEVIEGPVRRSGAVGPIDSLYLRDPDGNLLEIARPVADPDPIAPLRAWLVEWQERVRAVDFAGGRRLCASGLVAFGTRATVVEGLERVEAEQWRHVWPTIRDFTVHVADARGAVAGDHAWVAAPWSSLGVRRDGSTFPRPGRLTIALRLVEGRWLATHTHFSLAPAGA
jgi:catechol 2,3-dioxygenase-like lactoylglutathione lyase family enzyme/ketosteroid isomerase-like protein